MLPEPVSILLVDSMGVPVDGLVPVLLVYKDRLGVSRTKPLVANTSGGRYWFQPTTADVAAGVVWVLSCPGASTPYLFDTLYDPAYPFLAVLSLDPAGGLAPTFPPVWVYYLDVNGLPTTRPTLTGLTPYLWVALPSDSSLASGVQWAVDTQGAIPSYYSGTARSTGIPSAAITSVPPTQRSFCTKHCLTGIVNEKTYFSVTMCEDC